MNDEIFDFSFDSLCYQRLVIFKKQTEKNFADIFNHEPLLIVDLDTSEVQFLRVSDPQKMFQHQNEKTFISRHLLMVGS